MSKKTGSGISHAVDPTKAERLELTERIVQALPRDGKVERQPGLILYRTSAPTEPVYGVSTSCFCVIAQGGKHVMLGEDRFRYDPNHYLISTVGAAHYQPGRCGIGRRAVSSIAPGTQSSRRDLDDGRGRVCPSAKQQ
jgi:hypothetical protein